MNEKQKAARLARKGDTDRADVLAERAQKIAARKAAAAEKPAPAKAAQPVKMAKSAKVAARKAAAAALRAERKTTDAPAADTTSSADNAVSAGIPPIQRAPRKGAAVPLAEAAPNPAIRTVYLHVGHGKTGTSFIQSAFSLSRDAMRAHGIHYPILPVTQEKAAKGEVTGGNYPPEQNSLAQILDAAPYDQGDTAVLLTAESMFNYLLRGKRLIDDLKRAFPAATFEIMLFTRDPMEQAISSYQQAVKLNVTEASMADYLRDYNVPERVAQFITLAAEDGLKVTVRNYSRHSKELLALMEGWMGLPANTLAKPPHARVNRSMTRAEMALQSALSRHIGSIGYRLVSQPLCNSLPDIASDIPYADAEAITAFTTEMERQIALVHPLIDPSEYYNLSIPDSLIARMTQPTDPEKLVFSAAQLDVIGAGIAKQYNLLRDDRNITRRKLTLAEQALQRATHAARVAGDATAKGATRKAERAAKTLRAALHGKKRRAKTEG